MRILHSKGFIRDKKFIFAFILALICSIICGIVLYKAVISNIYLINFADDYIFNVFNFRNGTLLFTRLLSDLIYFYIIFAVCYFSRFKYLTLFFIFLKGLFFGVYTVILIVASSFGGVVVAVFVFVPVSLLSFAMCYLVADLCKDIYKKYALVMPLAFALINCVIYAVLINVLFRIVIIIV